MGRYTYNLKNELVEFKDSLGATKRTNAYGGLGRLRTAQEWDVAAAAGAGALVENIYEYAGDHRVAKYNAAGTSVEAVYIYGPGLDELLYVIGTDVVCCRGNTLGDFMADHETPHRPG